MLNASLRKRQLRRTVKSRLELLRPFDSAFLRERLRDHVIQTIRGTPGVWGVYRPLPHEADPMNGRWIGAADVGESIEWCFPRLIGDDLEFARGTVFERSGLGFEQPVARAPAVSLGELAGILVPGLAFDRRGGRLGRGRGYYDRALKGYGGMKVGIAFSCQILDGIPLEDWDLEMDAIITEQSVISCKGVFR